MCGIVAIVTGPDGRRAASPEEILAVLDRAVAVPFRPEPDADAVLAVARHAAEADRLLRGVPGVRALLGRPELAAAITARLDVLDRRITASEERLEAEDGPAEVEAVNAALVTARDALWAIRADGLLRLALAAPTARVTVLGHTRWASVGIISEPNAHPLNHEEDGVALGGPYVVAALNGDVDNHADLKAAHELRVPPPITTDAKVIP